MQTVSCRCAARGNDFRLSCPSAALEARRWQKLVRQLEALVRKLTGKSDKRSVFDRSGWTLGCYLWFPGKAQVPEVGS